MAFHDICVLRPFARSALDYDIRVSLNPFLAFTLLFFENYVIQNKFKFGKF